MGSRRMYLTLIIKKPGKLGKTSRKPEKFGENIRKGIRVG